MADKPNMTEITTFDKTKLKKTDTQEKNPLPTKESKYLVRKQQLRVSIWNVIQNVLLFLLSYQFITIVFTTEMVSFWKPTAYGKKKMYIVLCVKIDDGYSRTHHLIPLVWEKQTWIVICKMFNYYNKVNSAQKVYFSCNLLCCTLWNDCRACVLAAF